MDAEALLRTAIDPVQWQRKSRELRQSADRLWEAFFVSLLSAASSRPAGSEEAARGETQAVWEQALSYLLGAKLLYGYAIEVAFKALILRTRPADIRLETVADGTGAVREVSIKQFGVSLGAGHNLEQLGELAGVFDRSKNPIFASDGDYKALREILKHLAEVVLWSGRYPVPLRSGDDFKVPSDMPAKIFGHYLRDWIDPLLDHCLGDSAGTGRALDELMAAVERARLEGRLARGAAQQSVAADETREA